MIKLYIWINVKKNCDLDTIGLVNGECSSKTAKITKKDDYPTAHRLNVNVLLSNNYHLFVIFVGLVLDVS